MPDTLSDMRPIHSPAIFRKSKQKARLRLSQAGLEAEGMGFEPTTGFPASDFESDRWPIRLPSGTGLYKQRPRPSDTILLLSVRRGKNRNRRPASLNPHLPRNPQTAKIPCAGRVCGRCLAEFPLGHPGTARLKSVGPRQPRRSGMNAAPLPFEAAVGVDFCRL